MSPATYSSSMNRISKGVSEGIGGKGRAACTLKGKGRAWGRAGFTLIELLAVIAIIALLAGIVLSTSGIAIFKSRESRMRAEHGRIVTAIESYKLELGNYPPDNQTTASMDRHERAGRNSLYYELSGCTFENADGGTFVTQNQSERIRAADLKAAFGVNGVENSARGKRDVPWKGVSFKANQYAELSGFDDAEILITPLPGPHQLDGRVGTTGSATKKINPWFYDASSTNRNNPESFDLWSEYTTRDGNKVIGNWKY